MKIKNSQILFALVAIISLSSCQEVIDIELNDADRKFVIEGGVFEGSDSAMVRVTKTASYFSEGPAEGVTDALVQLTMPDNSIIEMTHMGNGMYRAQGLNVINEANYGLKVSVDNQVFTATSYMMPSVALDSLEYEYQEPIFGQEDGYNVFLHFQDQFGKNFYRMRSAVNRRPLNKVEDIQVVDDNLNDGNPIRIPIFTHLYKAGDTVEVELQSLDAELYEFYQTFAAAASEDSGSPFTAAPSNPETNIKGGALGVFGAYTTSRRVIILPQ